MIQGWTTVIAQDTNAPVEGVAITAMPGNETDDIHDDEDNGRDGGGLHFPNGITSSSIL